MPHEASLPLHMNPRNNVGNTPLHYFAKNGNLEACLFIMKHVEEKNPTNMQGCTPLHYAAQNGHLEVCKLLIENIPAENSISGGLQKRNTLDNPIKFNQIFLSKSVGSIKGMLKIH